MEMDNKRTNLIINYIPQTLTDEEFRSMFLSIGPIKSAKIVRDKATGYSYGFGFVDYENVDDAQRAMQTLNGLQMQNKTIKVALARPGGDEIKGANLYVRNLPRHYQQMDLERLFQQFGTIIQSRVLTDQNTGMSKGVGFVLFDQKKQAEEAINQITGTVPVGGTEALLIKFADDNAKKGYGRTRGPHGVYHSHQR
ncbi:ELAV-like protein 4 [Argonauta hians]